MRPAASLSAVASACAPAIVNVGRRRYAVADAPVRTVLMLADLCDHLRSLDADTWPAAKRDTAQVLRSALAPWLPPGAVLDAVALGGVTLAVARLRIATLTLAATRQDVTTLLEGAKSTTLDLSALPPVASLRRALARFARCYGYTPMQEGWGAFMALSAEIEALYADEALQQVQAAHPAKETVEAWRVRAGRLTPMEIRDQDPAWRAEREAEVNRELARLAERRAQRAEA
ncbi:MAG: hypothetical protein AAFU38_09370 [Bacteroidota bacterium]